MLGFWPTTLSRRTVILVRGEKDPVAAYAHNKEHVIYVHTSESHRGVPGGGQVPLAATLKALKQGGYDG